MYILRPYLHVDEREKGCLTLFYRSLQHKGKDVRAFVEKN
jgi:hypothetical protein